MQRFVQLASPCKAGRTRHTPFAYPKREYSAWSARFSSTALVSPHPSSPISRTPYQPTPAGPTHHTLLPSPSPLSFPTYRVRLPHGRRSRRAWRPRAVAHMEVGGRLGSSASRRGRGRGAHDEAGAASPRRPPPSPPRSDEARARARPTTSSPPAPPQGQAPLRWNRSRVTSSVESTSESSRATTPWSEIRGHRRRCTRSMGGAGRGAAAEQGRRLRAACGDEGAREQGVAFLRKPSTSPLSRRL
jgi:hypothetical protein